MNILGMDIGGSGVKAAIVASDSGDLLSERHRIPTPQPAKPKSIAQVVTKMTRHFNWKGPIGCGFPAVVQKGVVRTASNIDNGWIGINAEQLFRGTTGCDTFVINDADAAGIAEMSFGAGRDLMGTVVIVTVGTGIGSSFFIDGRLFPNTEFGQFQLNGEIAEKYAADIVRKELQLSWKKWGKRFNTYLQHLELLIWPELIIIGGGVSKKFEKFSKYLKTEAAVVPATLLNNAGIIGAAMAGYSRIQNSSTNSSPGK